MCMSVTGYPLYKGVNPERKPGVDPRRRLAGAFVTFRQLLHPPWSSSVLTLSCCWIGRTGKRVWGWFLANLLPLNKSSATHQSTFIPWYYLKTCDDRRATKQHWKSYSDLHIRLRLYGRSLFTRAHVMFGSGLRVWAALSRTAPGIHTAWGTGLKKCLKHCLFSFTLTGLLQSARTYRNKKAKIIPLNIAA